MRSLIGKFASAHALAFGILLLVPTAEAWSADNQASAELIEKGRKIWLTVAGIGCAGCHGRFGEGDMGIGPYNRGVGLSKIQSSIAAVDQMRMLQGKLDSREIEAVAAYNSWLGQHQLVKTLVKRDRFEPDTVDIFPGTAVQLAINNSSQSPRKFASPNMDIAEFQVSGREIHDFVWQAPEKEGTYTLLCVDCRGQGERFTINVRRSAKPYRAPEKELR